MDNKKLKSKIRGNIRHLEAARKSLDLTNFDFEATSQYDDDPPPDLERYWRSACRSVDEMISILYEMQYRLEYDDDEEGDD